MKNLREADINGKRVLVRCDFNVPVYDDGSIADKFRINQALPTIEYLRSNNAKVVLISHLGRPEGKDKKFSLKKVAEYLDEKIGGAKFYGDCIGRGVEKEVGNMKEGEVLLLENLRFYKEEEANDLVFSEKLAGLADIFVQEGFSVCHREHASVVGVAKLIPAYPGFLLEKEVNVLRKALENPERPLVSIVGGVKLETKIKLLEKLLEVSDYVLVGGKIANTILVLKGICVKDNWSKEESGLADVVSRIDLTSTKLHLPLDGVIALKDLEQKYMRVGAVGTLKNDESIYDIGPDTVEKFKAIIKEAGTIIWNGPMGYSEIEAFENGTKEIMQAVADNEGFAILGGGETAEAVAKFKIEDKFEHVSTGGGAMLDFISGDNLPGISILD